MRFSRRSVAAIMNYGPPLPLQEALQRSREMCQSEMAMQEHNESTTEKSKDQISKEYVNLLTDEDLHRTSSVNRKINYIKGVLDMCCGNDAVRDVCKDYLQEIGQLAVRTKA